MRDLGQWPHSAFLTRLPVASRLLMGGGIVLSRLAGAAVNAASFHYHVDLGMPMYQRKDLVFTDDEICGEDKLHYGFA